MAESTSSPPDPGTAPTQPPVVVKKYANRRLYNTETSSYITLDNLAEMVRAGRDFVVYDAKSGEDITRGVLTQIIVEEESKGSAMLPTNFLRQLIGFYGGNLQGVVPRYLELTMTNFARQQQQMRTIVERTFSPFLPAGVDEINRQNLALVERAFSMWNPFLRPGDKPPEPGVTSEATDVQNSEIARLHHEIEALQRQLAAAHAAAVAPTLPTPEPEAPAIPAPPIPANVASDAPTPLKLPPRRAPRNKSGG